MTGFWTRHSRNALIGATLASVIGAVSSLFGAGLTYYYSKAGQDRQAKLEQITKFDASSGQIIEAAGAFITAINESKDLGEVRQKISTVVASQMHDSDNISKFFPADVSNVVKQYQGTLADFNQLAQKTSKPIEMRLWSEGFGRALDAKSALSRRLYSKIGVDTRA